MTRDNPESSAFSRIPSWLVMTALASAGVWAAGCSDDPEPAAGEDAAVDTADDDTIVWADTGTKDSWSQIIDTNAPDKDVGVDSSGQPKDVPPVDVALPLPATVPTDLPPDVQVIPLPGTMLEEDGKTKVHKVVLPAGTASFLAVVRGQHPGHFTVATAVTPKGDLLGKGQCQPLCTSCKNRIASAPANGSVLFPNASGVQVIGGTWHLSSCGFEWKQQGNSYSTQPLKNAPISAYVLARVRPDGQAPKLARLKVRLWFAGKFPNAAQSFDDPKTVVMLATAATALNTADIELDVIDRINAPTGFGTITVADGLTTDHSSNADQLFAAAQKEGGSAVLDVFVVDSLSGATEGGEQVNGWAGGVPGPVGIPGSVRAGIVIALDGLADGATAGRQLAHEIGHYLGLFDSTTADGGHDPLDSTPACPASQSGDDGLVTADECEAYDGGNVMFWKPVAKAAKFTIEQGRIMRGNPIVWAK